MWASFMPPHWSPKTSRRRPAPVVVVSQCIGPSRSSRPKTFAYQSTASSMSPTVNPTWFMPALGDFPDIRFPAPRSAGRSTDNPVAPPLRLDRTSSSWLRNFLTTAGPPAPPGPVSASADVYGYHMNEYSGGQRHVMIGHAPRPAIVPILVNLRR